MLFGQSLPSEQNLTDLRSRGKNNPPNPEKEKCRIRLCNVFGKNMTEIQLVFWKTKVLKFEENITRKYQGPHCEKLEGEGGGGGG